MLPGRTSIPAAGQPHRPHQAKLLVPLAGCPPGLSRPDLQRLLPGFLLSLMTTTMTTMRTYHSHHFLKRQFAVFPRASKRIAITTTARTDITTTLVARAMAVPKVSSSDWDMRHYLTADTKSRAKCVQRLPYDHTSALCPKLCVPKNSLMSRKRRLPQLG
jgi:hypothetical protein